MATRTTTLFGGTSDSDLYNKPMIWVRDIKPIGIGGGTMTAQSDGTWYTKDLSHCMLNTIDGAYLNVSGSMISGSNEYVDFATGSIVCNPSAAVHHDNACRVFLPTGRYFVEASGGGSAGNTGATYHVYLSRLFNVTDNTELVVMGEYPVPYKNNNYQTLTVIIDIPSAIEISYQCTYFHDGSELVTPGHMGRYISGGPTVGAGAVNAEIKFIKLEEVN
jgi:hypothetical protein